MKVYDRNLTGAAAGPARTEDTQKTDSRRTGGTQSSSRSGSDQVELSGTLGRLSQALSTQGTQRASKVSELTAVYQSGNYKPNAAGASQGLVAEALSGGGGH